MSGERNFWSRRRAAVEAEERAERAREEERATREAQAAFEDRSEEEVLAELDLPVPETVCSPEDVQKFLAKAVPEYLRRRALRTLWRSNPVLACLDGLNDYDGDFTNAATDAPNLKTAYQVGKGLKAHVDYLAQQKAANDADAAAEPPEVLALADTAEDAPEEADATPPAPEARAESDTPEAEETVETPRPRRMAFRFEGDAA